MWSTCMRRKGIQFWGHNLIPISYMIHILEFSEMTWTYLWITPILKTILYSWICYLNRIQKNFLIFLSWVLRKKMLKLKKYLKLKISKFVNLLLNKRAENRKKRKKKVLAFWMKSSKLNTIKRCKGKSNKNLLGNFKISERNVIKKERKVKKV